MRTTRGRRALAAALAITMLLLGLGTEPAARASEPSLDVDRVAAQAVVNPNTIGPARNWDRVDPAYRYYYGPNYGYDPGWYAQRHLAYPNNYVAYSSDPGNYCGTEYYYMPSDSLYYCYQPDPVAMNSQLQNRCPDQPYLYICPDDLR